MSGRLLAGLLLSVFALLGVSRPESPTSIEFDGETFVLKYREALPNGFINEYFLPAESVEAWTRLISVQWFTRLSDHRMAVGDLIKTLLASNPQAKYEAWKSDDGTFTGVDFVVWQDDRYVEFNIFIYRAHPSGNGLLAQQYARRAYGDDRLAFMRDLPRLRQQVLGQVVSYQFPDVIAE